ncbi:hypothetical protein MTR67_038773 [Solanum verrucosum]|uniref:Integrase catalytic domain-containing protein n=1 Tax=Solanum verrucosum TaxID=315347 RepID=A0AAF0UGI6_SOLVR|nr:hypothetical protein MTR67_038773 [Solanum verrucosum]
MTTKDNREVVVPVNPNMGTMATRVRDFTRMNPPELYVIYRGQELQFQMDTNIEPPLMDSMPVVQELTYVFPNDLLGEPPDRDIDFSIDLKSGSKPIYVPSYYMDPTELKGIEGSVGAVLFSKIDLRFVYHHLKIMASDIPKKTFRTRYGHYELFVMLFNSTNAHATFIELMNAVFRPYLDTFERMREDKFYSKFSKCEFWLDFVAFLGHVVSKEFLQVDPSKIEVVRGWTRPTPIGEKICVSKVGELIRVILEKAHCSQYSIHPGSVKCEHQRLEVSIVSDRGSLFTSHSWKALQHGLGTQLDMSTSFHPQTFGHSKQTIQVLEDILRACVIDFGARWDKHLPLTEFSYNKNYHFSFQMAPFKVVIRFRKKGKLCARFIRPFEILSRVVEVAYKLVLPPSLSVTHPVFHVFILRKYVPDESNVLSLNLVKLGQDFSFEEEPIAILDKQCNSPHSWSLWSVHGGEGMRTPHSWNLDRVHRRLAAFAKVQDIKTRVRGQGFAFV